MHPFLTLPSANPGVFRATQEGLMEKRDAWEKVTPPWKKVPTASIFSFSQIPPCGLMQQGEGQAGREQQMAGETNYDEVGGKPLLRKKITSYVKNITSYVKKITSYVKNFT